MPNGATEIPDFSRSFIHYTAVGHSIWVRIQIDCRCQLIDLVSGQTDEYVLSVRTQTGLRDIPPDESRDPGYDFWFIFGKDHVFTRREHTSSYNNNPTRVTDGDGVFLERGWKLAMRSATPLGSVADVSRAVKGWKEIVGRTEWTSADGRRACRIEYPVKWADGALDDDAFRVETGPVVYLDAERVRPGQALDFDDFRWMYLDYRSFDRVRCFVERPTSILVGATYRASAGTPRREPSLTREQVERIEEHLFSSWDSPIPFDSLRRLLQTTRYSAVAHYDVKTQLFALDGAGRPND